MITLGDDGVRHLAGGARPRDGAPVVRRPGHAGRLARRLDERGHGDVPPGRRGRPSSAVSRSRRCWTSGPRPRRRPAGPTARRRDYDPASFGGGNVYYGPALMWDELRKRLGDDEFWRLVREWPATHDNGNADYDDITSWWSEQTRRGPVGTLRRLAARRDHPRARACERRGLRARVARSVGRGRRGWRAPLVEEGAGGPLRWLRRAPWRPSRNPLPAAEVLATTGRTRFGGQVKLLVLGGSVFLSRAVAADAVRRGHDVTCANRGTSGAVPEGAAWSRGTAPSPCRTSLGDTFDAVVDVGRYPSWVRSARRGLPQRPLGLRLHDQRLRRRVDARRSARDAAAARSAATRTSTSRSTRRPTAR